MDPKPPCMASVPVLGNCCDDGGVTPIPPGVRATRITQQVWGFYESVTFPSNPQARQGAYAWLHYHEESTDNEGHFRHLLATAPKYARTQALYIQAITEQILAEDSGYTGNVGPFETTTYPNGRSKRTRFFADAQRTIPAGESFEYLEVENPPDSLYRETLDRLRGIDIRAVPPGVTQNYTMDETGSLFPLPGGGVIGAQATYRIVPVAQGSHHRQFEISRALLVSNDPVQACRFENRLSESGGENVLLCIPFSAPEVIDQVVEPIDPIIGWGQQIEITNRAIILPNNFLIRQACCNPAP